MTVKAGRGCRNDSSVSRVVVGLLSMIDLFLFGHEEDGKLVSLGDPTRFGSVK